MKLWMIRGYCRLTGPWRQLVRARTAAQAIADYCAEHGMNPAACTAAPA